ncbi:hypothetical protein AAE478_004239 [Parahypoxylon ruwenzoriense]
MFEVPGAKRVRREDLYDSASDEETTRDEQQDSALRGKLNAQLSGLLDLSLTADTDTEAQQPPQSGATGVNYGAGGGGDTENPGEEAFAFRLFRDEEPSHKVVLVPQNAEAEKDGDGAFVVAKRPISYYLAGEPPPDIAEEFRAAAVRADYLLQDARKRRWGLERPWKVTTVTITTNKGPGVPGNNISRTSVAETGKQKRKRLGKKRRIIIRVREKGKREREEATKQQVVDKEEHLKEKKKRLNRQKKLKRRAKEREKKQGVKDDATSERSCSSSSRGSRDNSPA